MNDDVTRFEDVPGGMPRLKHGVDFGAGAMPCVISKARMQPKLLAYLVSDPMLMGPEVMTPAAAAGQCSPELRLRLAHALHLHRPSSRSADSTGASTIQTIEGTFITRDISTRFGVIGRASDR